MIEVRGFIPLPVYLLIMALIYIRIPAHAAVFKKRNRKDCSSKRQMKSG